MVGTLSAGFVSCSEDDETPVETTKERQLQALSTTYVNDVVTKTYSNLANEAEKLYSLIAVLKSKVNAGTAVTQGEVDAICTSYKTARSHWEESEAWLYGAASDYEIDPSIDSWPLEVKALAEDLTNATKMAAISNTTGAEYIRAISDLAQENRGFHGLEFIFFRNGSNRLAKYFSKTELEDDAEFAGKHITGEQEIAFAMATAAYLRDRCYQLEVAWLGDKAPAAHKARVAECEKVDPEAFGTKQKVNGQYYGQNMLAAVPIRRGETWWKIFWCRAVRRFVRKWPIRKWARLIARQRERLNRTTTPTTSSRLIATTRSPTSTAIS